MITREQLEKDLENMFKSMDEFEYENYGKNLWCMLRNQTPDLFVDDLICEFDYDYDDLMDIDLEEIVEDTIENIIIPKLTGLDEDDSIDKFEEILDSLEEKFNEEEGIGDDEDGIGDDEEEEPEETKYDNINLNLELYHEPGPNSGKWCIWIGDNIGGSGIDVTGSTKEECAQEAAKYLVDYLYRLKS